MKDFQTAWLVLLLLAACGSLQAAEHDPRLDDAQLWDISFVDADYGWAVGQHGAILHTSDGGTTWQAQPTPVDCLLRGVSFVDRQHGWAVGGITTPYTWTSRAVVLATRDGGHSWQQQENVLPALTTVQFFDQEHGVAVGHSTTEFPSGLFTTSNGGRDWRPLGFGEQTAWLAAHFLNPSVGIAVGTCGRATLVTPEETSRLQLPTGTSKPLRDVKLVPPGSAWIVGDGGTVLESRDLGRNWQPHKQLAGIDTYHYDFSTIANHGQHLWLAGSPGNLVLHSADGGQTWQQQTTGITTPIGKLKFLDPKHGWAVGSLGKILRTTDGGKHWEIVRNEETNLAALALFADVRSMPWTTLAQLSRGDGYRTAAVLLSPESVSNAAERTLPSRLSEAGATLDLSSLRFATDFRRPSSKLQLTAEQTVAVLDHRHQEKFHERLTAELVRQIRLWQPEVVLLPGENSDSRSLDSLLHQATLEALRQAAADEATSDTLHLPPWQPSRIYAALPSGERGTHRVAASEVVPRASGTLADLTAECRSLLEEEYRPAPEVDKLQLIASHAGEITAGTSDLLQGLGFAPGSACRRAVLVAETPEQLLTQRRLAEKKRNLSNLLRSGAANPAWLGQLSQLMGDLDANVGGMLLYEMADNFRTAGQFASAAEVLHILLRRYPEHRLVDSALLWLVQYYTSSELAHTQRRHEDNVQTAIAENDDNSSVTLTNAHEGQSLEEESLDFGTEQEANYRRQRVTHLVNLVSQTRPQLYHDPRLRFLWTVTERRGDDAVSAEQYLLSLSHAAANNPWRDSARAEIWLINPMETAPDKPRAACRTADSKPQLDGTLEEPYWQASPSLTCRPDAVDTETNATEVWFAYDEEFLYLAIRCRKEATLEYTTNAEPRRHDEELEHSDRVQLLIDVDRDYTSTYELTIDSEGRTAEACFGNVTWNPHWYVAQSSDGTSWTIEAAVPWQQLVPHAPSSQTTWALALERVIPGLEASPWTGPLQQIAGPDNFGLLRFE